MDPLGIGADVGGGTIGLVGAGDGKFVGEDVVGAGDGKFVGEDVDGC